MDKMPLSDLIKTEGQTGDILLFEGWSIFGLFEEAVTISPYSHVAMLVRNPTNNQLYVWESSNADDLIDQISGRRKGGPRLVDAHDKIDGYLEKYGTGIIYRKLIKPPGTKVFSPSQWGWMMKFMKRESPKHFEQYPWNMAESWTHTTIRPRHLDLSSVFCSEEVANTWHQAGVPMMRMADMYCPQDFSLAYQDVFPKQAIHQGWGLSPPFEILVNQ